VNRLARTSSHPRRAYNCLRWFAIGPGPGVSLGDGSDASSSAVSSALCCLRRSPSARSRRCRERRTSRPTCVTRRSCTAMPSRQAGPRVAASVRPSAPVTERRRIVASKVTAPPLRPGVVARPALLDALMSAADAPVVLVSAPAGYGKTMLLALWSERDERPFVWVSLDASAFGTCFRRRAMKSPRSRARVAPLATRTPAPSGQRTHRRQRHSPSRGPTRRYLGSKGKALELVALPGGALGPGMSSEMPGPYPSRVGLARIHRDPVDRVERGAVEDVSGTDAKRARRVRELSTRTRATGWRQPPTEAGG
jgi:hypothetical protein